MNDFSEATRPETAKVPQVSIGMPVYNGAKFIREALNSLLAQTFTDFELIISDNASTDGTEGICQEYVAKDKRVRYVRQPQNIGAAANFFFVLDEAQAEYFMWAAADDLWDKNWLELLLPVTSLRRCLSYGYMLNVRQNGTALKGSQRIHYDFSGGPLLRKIKFLFNVYNGKANPIYGLMPRSIINENDRAALETSDAGSDMKFLYKLLNKTEIKFAGNSTLRKRLNNNEEYLQIRYRDKNIILKLLGRLKGLIVDPIKLVSENIFIYGPLGGSADILLAIISSPIFVLHVIYRNIINFSRF